MPALAAWARRRAARRPTESEQGPEHEGRDGQRDDRDGCAHGRKGSPIGVVGRVAAPTSGTRPGCPTIAAVHVYGDLLRYRELFGSLFRRDLRAKYKGSFLGLAWTLALPLALMLVYLVVFSVLWKAEATDLDDYWLFLLCGLPPWVFLASSLQTAARSLSRTRRSFARSASRASSSRSPSSRRSSSPSRR